MTKKSTGGDDLAGVEAIFEKNIGKFNNLISQSDASKQLAKAKAQVKEEVDKEIN